MHRGVGSHTLALSLPIEKLRAGGGGVRKVGWRVEVGSGASLRPQCFGWILFPVHLSCRAPEAVESTGVFTLVGSTVGDVADCRGKGF